MPEPTGLLPRSTALAGASPHSLNILMSLDPEDPNFVENLPRIVAGIRAEAEARARAQELGAKRPRPLKAAEGQATTSAGDANDLDF